MLNRIILENWRSHAKTQIELKSGANMFLGSMGSGKSSVVDAICFCLYGTYPKLRRRDVKLSDVHNFRHLQEPVAVEIFWTDETDKENVCEYRVRREVEPATAWVHRNGKMICKGARAAREEVEKILQIPYELFARAVYAEQNKMDYWLSLSAGERKSEIDLLLGLDKFENARSNSSKEASRMRERALEIEQDYTLEKLDAAKEIAQKYFSQIEEKKKEIETAKAIEPQLEIERSASVLEFSKVEGEAKEFRGLNDEINSVGGKIVSLEKNIKENKIEENKEELLGKIEKLKNESLINDSKLLELEKESRSAGSKKSEAKMRIGQNTTKIERKKILEAGLLRALEGIDIKALERKKDEMAEIISKMKTDKAEISSRASELEKIVEAFDSSKIKIAKCPMCDCEISQENFQRVRQSKIGEIDECKKEISEFSLKIKSEENQLVIISRKFDEAKKINAQMGEIGEISDLKILESSLFEIEKGEKELILKIESMRKEGKEKISQMHELKTAVEKCDLSGRWKKEMEEAVFAKGDLGKKISALNFSQEKYSKAIGRKEKIEGEILRQREKIKSLNQMLAQSEAVYSEQKNRLLEIEKKREDSNSLRAQADEIVKFREVVIATQAQLRENLVGEINSAMHKLWPVIYPYGDWSSVRLFADENDYAIQIHQGEWRDLEAHASGGERACLGLCLRTAMSIILTPHLGWIILDEPTHNLDERAVKALGESISVSMPKIIPQILVITHDSKLLEAEGVRGLMFERNKMAGEDTRVIEI